MKKLLLFLGAVYLLPAMACTFFATFNGANNTLLIAKNRDNRVDRQVIQVVATPGKYKYLALSRQDVPDFVSAGINDHNLAVFNEVTLEYAAAAKGGIANDFSKDILESYSKARDVIAGLPKLVAKFPDPVFYQISDSKQILSVEVAPHHKFSYKLIDRGVYTHANNYLDTNLIKAYPYTASENVRLSGSITRLNRAAYLLNNESMATLQTMQAIGLDHNAGPNNSILRVGNESNPKSVKSLAFFAVQIDKTGKNPSEVNANLYNVGEKYHYVLDQSFWRRYSDKYTLLTPNETQEN